MNNTNEKCHCLMCDFTETLKKLLLQYPEFSYISNTTAKNMSNVLVNAVYEADEAYNNNEHKSLELGEK